MLSEVPAQCRMRCVAFLRTTNCSEPRHGRHGKALAHAATSARRSGTARTREAVVSSKMFESLVSRCLVVERLKVQSTQPVAAVAKLGRNCTRLAARFGHKLSRELLNCWSSCCTCGNACAAARHRASSGAPSAAAAGTGANLCTKTACAEACAYTKRRERKRAGRHALHRSCAVWLGSG